METTNKAQALRFGPVLTVLAASTAAVYLGWPLWAWALVAVLAWLPGPWSITTMVLDDELEALSRGRLDGANIFQRLAAYATLPSDPGALGQGLRALGMGLLLAAIVAGVAVLLFG